MNVNRMGTLKLMTILYYTITGIARIHSPKCGGPCRPCPPPVCGNLITVLFRDVKYLTEFLSILHVDEARVRAQVCSSVCNAASAELLSSCWIMHNSGKLCRISRCSVPALAKSMRCRCGNIISMHQVVLHRLSSLTSRTNVPWSFCDRNVLHMSKLTAHVWVAAYVPVTADVQVTANVPETSNALLSD